MTKIDFNLLRIFLAVADETNFRAAAERLGVTRSAVSQGIRKLEDQCGVALCKRTTRSVSLTEAGERLLAGIQRPVHDVETVLEAVSSETAPRGLLRVAVTSIAERFLSGPLVATFAAAYPDIIIDVTVTDEEFDIVGEGYDAGVRLGEVIEQDMIAVPITVNEREAVVAAPDYLKRHAAPRHPRELVNHRCIGWRPAPGSAPYRWEFCENGQDFDVAVEPQITTNDLSLMVQTTLAGGGITFVTEATIRPYLESGELVSMLEDFLPPFPGFYLYFPDRRNMAPKLRALVDHIKAFRS